MISKILFLIHTAYLASSLSITTSDFENVRWSDLQLGSYSTYQITYRDQEDGAIILDLKQPHHDNLTIQVTVPEDYTESPFVRSDMCDQFAFASGEGLRFPSTPILSHFKESFEHKPEFHYLSLSQSISIQSIVDFFRSIGMSSHAKLFPNSDDEEYTVGEYAQLMVEELISEGFGSYGDESNTICLKTAPFVLPLYKSFKCQPRNDDEVLICSVYKSDKMNIAKAIASDTKSAAHHAINEQSKTIAKQMLAGINSIHDRGYIHGDIQPANVAMFKDNSAVRRMKHNPSFSYVSKLSSKSSNHSAEIAAVKNLHLAQRVDTVYNYEMLGSHLFRAPELMSHDEDLIVSQSLDSWSAGVTLYNLCAEINPFDRLLKLDDMKTHIAGMPSLDPMGERLKKNCSKWHSLAVSVIGSLLTSNPEERMPIYDALIALGGE